MQLEGQVALVSGGSRGIGRAICASLARAGATVVAAARSTDAVSGWLAEESGLEGRVHPAALDVTDEARVEQLVAEVVARHERIDILVNNAGITRDGLLMSMETPQFDEVLNTNLRGAFFLMRACSRPMIRARRGRVVNIASISGIAGNAGQANYAAAKAGLIGMTKSFAKEVAKRGITVNAVAPGFIETDMTDVLPEKVRDHYRELIPMQRFGAAREIADAVLFLAGPGAAYMTGQTLVVDGGLNM
ncbi:MAG: 3-oxoacyl-[acyl-carrier-protein] reductase [Planctomycetia bacterium]|nr:MAG: 3-oxoacyl-[acyl-carrier-protein] reductase [Planctomycetia bacterium]